MTTPEKQVSTKNITDMLDSILDFIDISKEIVPEQMTGQQKYELLRNAKTFILKIRKAKADMVGLVDDQKDELILDFSDKLFNKLRK
jgi:hypothetical protein